MAGPPETESSASPEAPLHVVLFEPEIAANTGSIGRTCVALGAWLWLVRPLGFHLNERRRRRAGLDYWDTLTLRLVDSFAEVEEALSPGRLWLYSTHASRSHVDCDVRPGDALVFGPESRGFTE
jgi:tRNA (cytidine/uridine-2'-O-)-methyltransferase